MRRKDRKTPMDKRAPDNSKNGTMAGELEGFKNNDNGRVLLRVDSKTVILVKPENATEEYRMKWKENIEDSKKRTNY